MLITRYRQLSDGEELVWTEEDWSPTGFDPRDGAIVRRHLALHQGSVGKPERPSSDPHASSSSLTEVEIEGPRP